MVTKSATKLKANVGEYEEDNNIAESTRKKFKPTIEFGEMKKKQNANVELAMDVLMSELDTKGEFKTNTEPSSPENTDPNPNKCNSTLMSATRGEKLTPNSPTSAILLQILSVNIGVS